MTYLLAKYAVVFLLAVVFGFLLGRWWVRRAFVDVTESYQTISRAAENEVPWDSLWARFESLDASVRGIVKNELDARPFPKIPQPDFEPINQRFAELDARIAAIPAPERVNFDPLQKRVDQIEQLIKGLPKPEKPERVDLSELRQGLADVGARIDSLPVPEKQKTVDLEPIQRAIAALDARIAALPVPESAEPVDLSPVNARINALEVLIRNLPKPEKVERVDLGPVQAKLQRLETTLENLPKPEKAERIDLRPLDRRVEYIESAIRNLRLPKTDLSPLSNRLQIIEAHVTQLNKPQAKLKSQPSATPAKTLKLLKKASFGKADDLKRISGIGPMLEKLLNKHGVYYFWQVADWTKGDIKTMDDRLDVFKGRISRDEWVRQAKALARETKTATRPNADQLDSVQAL